MRVKNNTQRFQAFVRDLQESFWGDFQGRTREMLKKLLESDAEQQMAEYLGLKWHERAQPGERVDYRNGGYERDYRSLLDCVSASSSCCAVSLSLPMPSLVHCPFRISVAASPPVIVLRT